MKRVIYLTSFIMLFCSGTAYGQKCDESWEGGSDINAFREAVLAREANKAFTLATGMALDSNGNRTGTIVARKDFPVVTYLRAAVKNLSGCLPVPAPVAGVADPNWRDDTIEDRTIGFRSNVIGATDFLLSTYVPWESFSTGLKADPGPFDRTGEIDFLSEYYRELRVKVVQYWKVQNRIFNWLTYPQVKMLEGWMSQDERETFRAENAEYFEKHEAEEKEKARVAELKKAEQLALEQDELNALVEKNIRFGLSKEEKERQSVLLKKLSNQYDGKLADVPLSKFKHYPVVMSRFYLGSEVYFEDKIGGVVRPTLGYTYYRQPHFKDKDRYHFSTDLGVSSIRESVQEGSAEESVQYRVGLEQTVFRATRYSNVEESKDLKKGPVLKLGVNLFEPDDLPSGQDAGLKYQKNIALGYRAAFSPEQYTDLLLKYCVRFGENKLYNERCEPRIRWDLFMTTPTFFKDSKVQLGVGVEFRTQKEDTYDNSFNVSVRWQTSFNKLYESFANK